MNPEGEAHAEIPARILPDGSSTPETLDHAVLAGLDPDLSKRGQALEAMVHAATLPLEEKVEIGNVHCQRCEIIPRKLSGPGSLLVNLPHTHTIGKVMQWLRKSGLAYSEAAGTVTIAAPEGSFAPILTPLVSLLSSTERRLTRVVFQPPAQPIQVADYFRIEDIATFAARASSDWLLDLLREGRFTAHFQPIVACDDGRSVLGYECLLRGRSKGGVIAPGEIFAMAARADLVFQVDQAARRTALHAAARAEIAEKVFVNFTPDSIFDAAFCLDATVRTVDDLGLPHERVVFEIVESQHLPDLDHLKSIVAYYRDHGFGVALDDVGAGYASLSVLLALRPDYAKIDMGLVRDVHKDPAKRILASRLVETARELGAKTVVEGVEVAEEWAWAKGCGADYAQGYLFGRPAAKPCPPA